jgi:hypothetical protein
VRRLSIGTDRDANVEITGNTFVNYEPPDEMGRTAITVWAAYGEPVLIDGNNFFNFNGEYVLALPGGYSSANALFTNNFIYAAKAQNYGDFILDKADNLSSANIIDTTTSLTEPNLNAPLVDLELNYQLTDEAVILKGWKGNDQFGEVMGAT